MTYPLVDLMNMKFIPISTRLPISKHEVVHPSEKTRSDHIYEHYEHPWYKFNKENNEDAIQLKKPNPPSKEAIERAKFVDKTYHWSGSLRSGDERTNK